MPKVNVTELRQNLPSYLAEVKKGREIEVTSRGKVIARIVAGEDVATQARKRLIAARKRCRIGDITSPGKEPWSAEHDRS
jgi:prevent-host-death family protein